MVKFTSCLIGILSMAVQLAFGQTQTESRQTVNQSIAWFALNSNIKVSERVHLLAEGQFRQVRDFDPQQYQLRTGVDLKITDHLSIMPVGYVYTWNFLYGKQPAAFRNNEHRLFQQIVYKHSLGKIQIEHRGRLEERFIQRHYKDDTGNVVDDGYSMNQIRGRYRLMAKLPFKKEKIEARTYFAVIYDEVFMSWGEKVTYHKPDQNRIFAGAGYQVDKNFCVQGGPFYQMLIKGNGAQQENNIGILIQFIYNIDLTKHE